MGTATASKKRTAAFVKSFFRSYLTGACFNPRGYHSPGILFAMYPGLAAIHRSDPQALKTACRRYADHFNTHTFWVPCMVGILFSAEMLIAQDRLPPSMLEKIKDTTSYTLSAIGDSVFAGSLLIFWALSTICLLLAGYTILPLGMGIAFFIGLQVFRALTFWGGVRYGLSFLGMLKQWNLIDWGQRVKMLNAVLLLCLWLLAWPGQLHWTDWLLTGLGMGICARLLTRRKLPRESVIIGLILVLATAPWAAAWMCNGLELLKRLLTG